MRASEARPRSARKQALRWLFLIHRWIGIVSCLLFVMWFASGLVMIYVPYPSVSESERISRLPVIDWSRVETPAPSSADLRELGLEMQGEEPVWRLTPWSGRPSIVSARTGRPRDRLDGAGARSIAAQFEGTPVSSLEQIVRDQWTVNSRLDAKRPLWKASFKDAPATEVYVSSVTGEVVQRTQRVERLWNWIGSVPHWLYPTILRKNGPLWRQVVLWAAGPCMAAAMSGMWIGILRMRAGRRRYKGGRVSPYQGWMLWHHIAGLLGGVFLLGWIFSGWLSVDPGRYFSHDGISTEGERAYRAAGTNPPLLRDQLAFLAPHAKRVAFEWFSGRPLLRVTQDAGNVTILDANTLRPVLMDIGAIKAAAARLKPDAHIADVQLLETADAYWYDPSGSPTLPAIRVRFDDADRTWVHIDPASATVLGSIDRRDRLYRWLFDLLHKWDLNSLTAIPAIWKAVLWILLLPGLVISASGAWIGWKRLRRAGSNRKADAVATTSARPVHTFSTAVSDRQRPVHLSSCPERAG